MDLLERARNLLEQQGDDEAHRHEGARMIEEAMRERDQERDRQAKLNDELRQLKEEQAKLMEERIAKANAEKGKAAMDAANLASASFMMQRTRPQPGLDLSCHGLENFQFNSSPLNIVSQEELLKIWSDWGVLGVEATDVEKVGLEIARVAADIGSSEYTIFKGRSMHCNVCFSDLVGCIRNHTTLRRFCGRYAKCVWNVMLLQNEPPASWQRRGLKRAEAFAGFDFFEGVTSSHAITPDGGLVRSPTDEELIAGKTVKDILIYRSISMRNTDATTFTEVTGGRKGPQPKLKVKKV